MKAIRLNVTETFQIHLASGVVAESRLAMKLQDRRFFSLRNFYFGGCTWVLTPDASRRVSGISLTSARGRPFEAEFDRNSFVVEGSFGDGELITTGQYSTQTPANRVTARFINCNYPAGFGTAAQPSTHIATLHERGDYSFTKADLAGLDLHQAIQTPAQAQINSQGDPILIHIP